MGQIPGVMRPLVGADRQLRPGAPPLRRSAPWIVAVALAALLSFTGIAAAGSGGWRVLRSAPAASFYASPMCTDANHCWVPTRGPRIVATRDGGRRWLRETLPGGAGTQRVWCTTASVCWAPVYSPSLARHPLLGSTNGGRTWRLVRLQGQRVSSLSSLACAGVNFCLGIGTQTVGQIGFRIVVVSTIDGGRTWRASLPNYYALAVTYRVSCPAVGTCFAAGFGSGSASRAGIVVTTDGGARWRSDRVPRGIDLFWDIDCVSASRCWAVGRTGERRTDHGVMIATTDGGARWRSEAPPPDTLTMNGVSCVDARHCTSIGFHHDYSTVVVTTSDGGARWRRQAPPRGATFLSSVWCITARRCLAPVTYGYFTGGKVLLAATF
jgi:photosystem II stability/assembly factor-like uncharacterized protein